MRHFALLIVLFLFAISLHSMDWPSSSALVTKNFGWNEEGLPHLGISFSSGESIKAADKGELIFYRRSNDKASRLPSPLGSWLALDHGDGIVSIYSRFESSSSRTIPDKVEKDFVLGEGGISGWSSRNGFYFQLFDRKEKRWVNPSLIIPTPESRILPSIIAVRLKDSQGRLFNPFQIGSLSQGRYVISVEAIARSPEGNSLAPHRIVCLVNGSEAGVLNFETYSARNGSLMVYRNGLVPVRQVYAPVPAYEIADVWFSRGQTTLDIIAQDIAGNIRNATYRFLVN